MSSRPIRCLLAGFLLAAVPAAQSTVSATVTAAPGVVDLGPGFPAEPAWLYDATLPGRLLRLTEGQRLRVRFRNLLPEDTTLHWHGQPVGLGMDGMAGISRPSVAPGQEFTYELDGLVPGSYWFHPHSAMHHEQLDRGLHGLLVVDPAVTTNEPAFDLERWVVLDDWDAAVTGGTYTGHLLNGRTSLGQSAIAVQSGQRLRLRIVNVAAMTNYVLALDGHALRVTHADGNRVQDVSVQAIPVGIGERYDVIVDCNQPAAWSLAASTLQNRATTVVRGVVRYAGQSGPDPAPSLVPANLATGTLLSYAQLASFQPSSTPVRAVPDRTYPVALAPQMGGGMGAMNWTINGQVYPAVTPMAVVRGEVVQLDLVNQTPGMTHIHPMHLHGHSVRILGTAGGTTHAPLKDTVLVNRAGQPGSSWSVQFTADNPGRWLYHCHDMMHMANGMMTLVDYVGDADGDGLADIADMEPLRELPVLSIPEVATAFAPGAADNFSVQWQPGQFVGVHGSLVEQDPPAFLAPFGRFDLDPQLVVFHGGAPVAGNGTALVPYALPASQALVGVRLVFQGLETTNLFGGLRLTTSQAFHIH